MKIHRMLLMIAFFLAANWRGEAVALEMPKAIANVYLGMAVDDLIAARPNARFPDPKLPVQSDKLKSGKYALLENFGSSETFHTAGYWIDNGKVATISLLGTAPRGQEQEFRQRLMRESARLWGKKYVKWARESEYSPGVAQPMVTWEIGGAEIVLELHRNRAKEEGRPNNFGIAFQLISSAGKKHPRKEKKMDEAERKKFFKAHDIGE